MSMAKKVKFPLTMADGAQVRTLEELREHFDLAGAVDSVAFSQEDLADLLDEGVNPIYLCGELFTIPPSIERINKFNDELKILSQQYFVKLKAELIDSLTPQVRMVVDENFKYNMRTKCPLDRGPKESAVLRHLLVAAFSSELINRKGEIPCRIAMI
jgi:hypothetical protein